MMVLDFSTASVAESASSMKRLFKFIVGVVIAGVLLTVTGCSTVKPAGSMGYAMNGETRLRPVPLNYRHVPPKMEEVGTVQWQFGF